MYLQFYLKAELLLLEWARSWGGFKARWKCSTLPPSFLKQRPSGLWTCGGEHLSSGQTLNKKVMQCLLSICKKLPEGWEGTRVKVHQLPSVSVRRAAGRSALGVLWNSFSRCLSLRDSHSGFCSYHLIPHQWHTNRGGELGKLEVMCSATPGSESAFVTILCSWACTGPGYTLSWRLLCPCGTSENKYM